MSRKLDMEEALEMAMEAELKARAFYAQAALEVQDPAGRDLLGRLAAFEQHHYEKLAELTNSLARDGTFITYEGQTMQRFRPIPLPLEAGLGAVLLEEFQDVPGILSQAIDKEKVAAVRYAVLAEETTDPAGRDMFKKLVQEEQLHQRLLEDEFFSLSNCGVWGWSGMYGE